MAKIANVALTNTFNTWRVNSNQSFDRLSQFAINNSALYANNITANNVLRSSGNTVLGAAGKRAIVTGLLSANGRVTVGTNLAVSGNTSTNKLTVTNSFTSSGNTALGDGVADITTITGSASISKNLTVSGNTAISGLLANNALGISSYALKTNGTSVFWGIALSNTLTTTVATRTLVPTSNITFNLGSTTKRYKDIFLANSTIHLGDAQISASGNKVLFNNVPAVSNSFLTSTFATKISPTTSGLLAHTGRATVSTNLAVSGNTALGDGVADTTTITGSASISKNLTVSGNTSSNKLTVTNLFTSSGNTALGDGVADTTTITGSASISKNLTVSGNASVATLTATSDSSFTSTGAVTVSKGTTAQRPASPASGMFRFNTTNAEFEGYNGTAFASIGGGLPGEQAQVFTSSGTFTIPTLITAVKVTVQGGGGGGGGASGGACPGPGIGGGGGAGGAAITWLTSLTPGNTLSVTIGSAGAAGSSGGGAGGTGGTSSVASGTQTITTISGTGGNGGAGGPAGATGDGGAGGGTSGDAMAITGQKGDGANDARAATGGDSLFGRGGRDARGGAGARGGGDATGYGGGGSGAVGASPNLPHAGGAGTAGIVSIEW